MGARPTDIRLHQVSKVLEVEFDDGNHFHLPCEYLRVFSPSAEVSGHGPGQETLQTGKKDVNISELEPIGRYAVRLIFDDSHDSGLYSWDYLYELGIHQERNWQDYLARLEQEGQSREAPQGQYYSL